MLKKVALFAIAMAVSANLVLAENVKVKAEKAVKIDPNKVENFMPQVGGSEKVTVKKPTAGVEILKTNYDYFCNQSIPNYVALGKDANNNTIVYVTAMKRLSTQTTRSVELGVGDKDGFAVTTINGGGAGWASLQLFESGGTNVMTMYHRNSASQRKFIDPNFTVGAEKTVVAGNFPSFVILPSGKSFILNTNGVLYSSDDKGDNITQVADLLYLQNRQFAVDAGPSEYILRSSPNGKYIMTAFAVDYVGSAGKYGTTTADSADFIALVYSSDNGTNWTKEVIGKDGIDKLDNRTEVYPLFNNFGQVQGVVDNNGLMHVVANGYSVKGLTDTTITFAFPIIYWNNVDRKWIAISREKDDNTPNSVAATLRPGNGLGQSYPTIATTKDNGLIFVAWQGFEYDGDTVAIYTGGANKIFRTDLYYAYSTNAGKTWSTPAILKGEKNVQESYPYVNNFIEELGNNQYRVHYIYMVDAIPGTSLFQNNNGASDDSQVMYDYFDFTATPTGVENNNVKELSFTLEQNYPNPFNPTTKINYTIPEAGNVTLKVYDMLGKEVATLVNGYQPAGTKTVEFNASNLNSGVYVYKLSVNGKVQSKKMMLMK